MRTSWRTYFAECVKPADFIWSSCRAWASAWPLLRSHTLLKQPHPIMGGNRCDCSILALRRPNVGVRSIERTIIFTAFQARSVSETSHAHQNLCRGDIFRSITGVVKADQLDDSSIWQELDEFVVTRELDQPLPQFFHYSEAICRLNDPDVRVQSVGCRVLRLR